MAAPYPTTHPAVVTTAKRAPLSILEVQTEAPEPGEVVVRVQWTSSSPLDLHQADGGLLTIHPFILGCSFAGIVVAVGPTDPAAKQPNSAPLVVGDRVFGFTSKMQKQQGFQTYVTVPRNLMGRVPENLTMEAAVTAPANLVTAFHTSTQDLGLELPWPIPENYVPPEADAPILIWGAASSVGNFTVQVLHHWGYKNILAVASEKHHDELLAYGATKCFDYRKTDVTDAIRTQADHIPYVIDCIGQLEGTLRPLTRIAQKGTKVAIMMPAIVRDATDDQEPELSMDPSSLLVGEWKDGVELIGVRTFFYEQNEFFKWHLQPDIMPALLESGIIKPNKQRIVEAETLLERAQKALDLLRERAPSGERLVWRVAEE
ncbi:chaperonin 10-like protein [Ilyonectria robusta]|uniref:chaperonin 10-like protein n=1 Tax=Ilyonectria robusta TaxID=1079257 RepID=UPI001E8D1E2E|nr:chaperonin 10-like protein [Ilyonectria robusta]KAH8688372.1 chaperonin 10-like protein [Ilyonectria robusta]